MNKAKSLFAILAATSIAFSSITVCASAEETTDIFDNTTEYSEEFTEEDTNEEASSSARRTALWVVTEDNVRMRRTPSLSGEVLMLLYKGEYLYEGTPKKHVDAVGYTWILVSSNRTGWSGYVASDYIECNDY